MLSLSFALWFWLCPNIELRLTQNVGEIYSYGISYF